jgi:hypothetical protein
VKWVEAIAAGETAILLIWLFTAWSYDLWKNP